MNKVITINLNGNAYQLEEEAYEILHSYLEGASRQLAGNPDQKEILADIEQAIAEKCRAALGNFRTVVSLAAIGTILGEMGPVVDGTGESAAAGATKTSSAPGRSAASASAGPGGGPSAGPASAGSATPIRRLYRVQEGAMFGGVCNGLASFLGLPVLLIRFIFAGLIFLWGLGLFVYVAMLVFVPLARTPEGQAPVFDPPNTTADYIRRAREGYYEGLRHWPDRQARRAWKQQFKDEMRAWRNQVRTEVRAGTRHWSWQWPPPPLTTPPPPVAPPPGAFVLWPVFALIRGVLTFAFVAVILSLVFTGGVFGVALPWGLPMWMGIVFAALIFNALVWPFRWRRWWYGHGCHSGGAFFWVLLFVFFVWFSQHHHHGSLHDMGRDLTVFFRDVADSVRDWWHKA